MTCRLPAGALSTHGVSPVSQILLAASLIHCQGDHQVDFGNTFRSFDKLESFQSSDRGDPGRNISVLRLTRYGVASHSYRGGNTSDPICGSHLGSHVPQREAF